jgi:TPR repeat protein
VGGVLPKNEKLAGEWCLRAARQGDVAAETTLGYLYSTGKGVHKSVSQAMVWWRRAADQGSADAEFNLGEFYLLGNGVERDYKEALQWFRKAAEQGESDAQYHLGLMYEDGTGVGPDANEALLWYRLSAAQGFPDAREKVDAYAKLVPPQHEFSVGELPELSVDQALEQVAKEYSGQAADRVARDDIAFPASEEEYLALGKHAVLLLATVTHDRAELPVARVYLEKDNGVIELRKIGSFLCRTQPGSLVESVLGPYRENAFYLLPISAYFQSAKLLVDFSRNRTRFQLIQFPEDVKPDFVLADPQHALDTDLAVSTDVINLLSYASTVLISRRGSSLSIQLQLPCFNSTSTCRAISLRVSKTPCPWKATASSTGSFLR